LSCGLKEKREGEKDGPAGPQGKGERGERKKGFLSFLNSFQIIFKLSNFNQTRNHAFEL
jgi:hypothetical protein